MGGLLLGVEAFRFLKREGFSVLQSVLVQDEEEAAQAAGRIGFPVVLKIISQDVIHKTEAHGVKLCLSNQRMVIEGFREVTKSFKAKRPEAVVHGVMVQKQGNGFELIVGVIHDEQFGPVMMCGVGGIFAEAIRDVSFRLIPIERSDAWAMLEDLRGYEALKNPRREPLDLSAVARFLVRVSDCVVKHPEIREMDLNPVVLSSRSIDICDARIRIA